MRVLVLQQPSSVAPFESWLQEAAPDVEVRMITGAGTARPDDSVARGVRREVLDDYHAPATTRRVHEVCAEWKPDVIFSNAEADVLRAAEARTLFGIEGTTSSAAVLYRDKVLMKKLFAGIRVDGTEVPAVEYRAPSSGEEVLAACEEWGPVVLKPRDGSGSVSVLVLDTPAEAVERLAERPELLTELHRSQLILERFVEGDVYHVDILVRDGAPILVSPSRYLHPPHLFARHNVGSVMVDADSPDHRFLRRYAEELTARVGAAHRPNILHLELYRTPDGRFLAGEIACRGGGALVKESMRHTYGVDQAWAACLLSAGLLRGTTYLERVGPQSGWLLETAAPLEYDAAAPPAWVALAKGTRRSDTASSSVDAGLSFVVEGANRAEIEARMESLHAAV
ncbi:acetyl-CoA carboxylase biotin carboxylase subunit family protein [Streptomyces sp. NPDC018584]|uniref:ATP-grasp domain-containing protein n=1 Tax=unclassified Streptomyces TaxID=2593676 RepID=UPI00378A915C